MKKEFFKKYQKEIIVGIFVFLLVSLSFGLGYLLAFHFSQRVPIVIEKCSSK